MPVSFTTLLLHLIPLYLYVIAGYFCARQLKMDREQLSAFVFHVIFPTVIFTGVLRAELTLSTFSIPLLAFFMASLMCIFFNGLGYFVYRDARRNLLSMSAGQANTGYFGLPIAMMLFDEASVNLYILGILGVTIYENSLGYYIGARGIHNARESLRRVSRLPSLYAFVMATLLNLLGAQLPEFLNDLVVHVRGAYSILGMMIVGMGFAAVRHFRPDISFTALSFFAKFICWPALAYAIIALDSHVLHLLNPAIHNVLFLLSIVPMAANSVVIATLLKIYPEKIAFAVLLSTIIALAYVPFMLNWLLQ